MKPIICLSLLTAAALLPVTAFAGTTSWLNPSSGSWFTPENWSDGVPAGAEVVVIDNGTAEVDTTGALAGTLDISGNGALTILANSSLLTPAGAVFIHDSTLPGAAITVSGGDPLEDGIGLTTSVFMVGVAGTGRLVVNNGGVYANGGDVGITSTWATIGGAPAAGDSPFAGPGTGEMTVTGSGFFNAQRILVVGGYQGNGTLNVLAGGTANVFQVGGLSVLLIAAGEGTNAVGNVNVSGAGSTLHANTIVLADNFSATVGAGTGTLTVDAGGEVTTENVYLGPFDPIADPISAGHIHLNGTELGGRGRLYVEEELTVTHGSIDFDGGVLAFGGGDDSPMEGFGVGDVTLGAGGGWFDIDTEAIDLPAPIDGSGMFHKTGTGSITLTTTNYFTGGVTVEAGALIAGANSALPSAGPYVVNGGMLDLGGHLLHASSLSGSGGTIDIDGNFIVEQNDADTYFSGTITSDSAAEFYKMGSKQLILGGGMPAGGNIQVFVQGGELLLGNTSTLKGVHVGNGGTTGTLTVDEGSLTVTQYLTVGEDTGSTGTLTIGSSGTLTMGTGAALTVGYSNGTGTLNIQPGGILEVGGNGGLATDGALSSTVNFGGTIKVIGSSQLITSVPMTLSSATATVDTNGVGAIFSGALTGAGGLVKTGNGVLQLIGNSTYSTTGGSFDPATTIQRGAIFVDGGSISHPGAAMFVAKQDGDLGTLEVFGGGDVSNAYAYIGSENGAVGHANISGAGSTWTSANSLAIGYNGQGDLNVLDGGQVTTNGAYIAYASGSYGYATVSGTGSLWQNTGDFYVGNTDSGSLTIKDGGSVVIDGGTGTVNLGHYTGSAGFLYIGDYGSPSGGGTLSAAAVVGGSGGASIYFNQNNNVAFTPAISGSVLVTQRGLGETTMSGNSTYSSGTSITAGSLVALHNSAFGSGFISVDGGTLRAGPGITVANSITVGAAGGQIINYGGYAQSTFSGVISIAGNLTIKALSLAPAKTTVSGVITGLGNLTLETLEEATIELSGAFVTPTGTITHIGGGTGAATISGEIGNNVTGVIQNASSPLILTANNTYTGPTTVESGTLIVNGSITSDTTVKNGATFGGDGIVGDIILESGANLRPIDCFDGDSMIWNADATITLSLGEFGVSDVLELLGAFTKAGTGTFNFHFLDGGFEVGETYRLIDFDTTNFSADDFGFAGVYGGFDGTFAFDGSVLEFTLVAIPEPSAWALGMAGLMAVVLIGRRKRILRRD